MKENRKNRKERYGMPPSHNVSRYHYPLSARQTDIAYGSNSPFVSDTDINGSYTGTPTDGGKPTQDADDL